MAISGDNIDQMINQIQYNLQQIILLADEISQEFRRTIHVDVTRKRNSKKLRLLRELLETDNMVRDVLAKLRQANSKIAFDLQPDELLRNHEFLSELYTNLTQMFKSFDQMNTVMETDDQRIENLVVDTIESLDRFSEIDY